MDYAVPPYQNISYNNSEPKTTGKTTQSRRAAAKKLYRETAPNTSAMPAIPALVKSCLADLSACSSVAFLVIPLELEGGSIDHLRPFALVFFIDGNKGALEREVLLLLIRPILSSANLNYANYPGHAGIG